MYLHCTCLLRIKFCVDRIRQLVLVLTVLIKLECAIQRGLFFNKKSSKTNDSLSNGIKQPMIKGIINYLMFIISITLYNCHIVINKVAFTRRQNHKHIFTIYMERIVCINVGYQSI